ncbi:MAG: hypothetical protein AAFY71_28635, partial [Bacteroidota bacterium]
NPNIFNKLTIRKQGDFYHIYVNENYIDIYETAELDGDLMGFRIGGQTTIEVDYMRVNQLN